MVGDEPPLTEVKENKISGNTEIILEYRENQFETRDGRKPSDYVCNDDLEMYYDMSDDRYVQAEIWDNTVEIIPEVVLPRFPDYKFSTHIIEGVKSQLNPKMWLYELSFEHDYLKSYLKQGVTCGFKIVDDDVDDDQSHHMNVKITYRFLVVIAGSVLMN